MPPIAYLSRTAHFSAAHRLHAPSLSAEVNAEVYGKCNRANGHGHNYEVEIAVKGEIDPQTGMILNVTDLKQCIHEAIMEPLDHRHLDHDVPFFADRPSTTENLAIYIWDSMKRVLPKGPELYRVRLYETPQNYVEYFGEASTQEAE
ncbi:hypothetical protein H4R34_005476 [Dimargaris verticillata]|uniref:6-pyruvoyl tetrahydrobiopterin synthase n=1 Tax=Dimargaris verticillata TaxID=2761393 RepID=A0A9W8EB75_9FUNG|nr:hypothetical protein H4R34_005476 [Dimargaris verticillata]